MTEQVELKTGRERALAREAERAVFVQEYYANTKFQLNTRATKRRATKLLAKHERAMEVRQRFSRGFKKASNA